MNKKMLTTTNYLTACLATGIFLSQIGHAGISGVRTPGVSGSAGKNSSTVTVAPGKVVNEKVNLAEGTALASCDQDLDASTYFPLDFFQAISRDGSSLGFELKSDNKILLKMPPSLKSCGIFKPQTYQDPVTKNVTILIKLESGKTYSQYLACLEEKNILKDGKIDHDAIAGKEYSEQSYLLDYSFSKDEDIKKTLKLSFGYPTAFKGKDGYTATNGFDSGVELPLCMQAQKVGPESFYINKGQDVLINEIKAICESGNAQKISEAKKAIGNAEALKDVAEKITSALEAQYLVVIKGSVEEIYAKMQKIEDQLLNEQSTIDEASAKKLLKDYAELAKKLDSDLLNPSIDRLSNLMKQIADMDKDDPKRKALEDEIKKLNNEIGGFAARKNAFVALTPIMQKYALNDSAKVIEDIRLKSFSYRSVYPGAADERGKPLTFEQANQKQYSGLQKFDKVLTDWTDQYLAGKGNLFPILKTEKERSVAYERMNQRWYNFQINEQSKMQKYCGVGMAGTVNNPVQCRTFQAGAKARMNRELGKRKKDLLYIQGRNDKLMKMGGSYNSFQQRQVATESEESDPYGASYSSYEDDFSERFPGYTGAESYTPYDPSMYNMSGQAGAMNLQNTGNYNPAMVNPQAQVQQGQFQMQQWPSIR